jgi:hypothetical protein
MSPAIDHAIYENTIDNRIINLIYRTQIDNISNSEGHHRLTSMYDNSLENIRI